MLFSKEFLCLQLWKSTIRKYQSEKRVLFLLLEIELPLCVYVPRNFVFQLMVFTRIIHRSRYGSCHFTLTRFHVLLVLYVVEC